MNVKRLLSDFESDTTNNSQQNYVEAVDLDELLEKIKAIKQTIALNKNQLKL